MTTLSPPISPQPHENRPRAVSNMSHISNRSRRSSHSANKLELVESAKDKKRLDTKADPTKAMNEAQPAAVALEESNLEDIRRTQWKDNDGNVITDPDRSNPTRYRLERPLDTIRSFNAAAEGTSNRRSSYHGRPPPQIGTEAASRRTSYYGTPGSMYSPSGRPRPGAGGYYRNSSYGFQPESLAEEGPGPQARQTRYPAAPSDFHGESPTSIHSHQHSYETMTSGSDEFSKSTNPSSQNSSYDRLHQASFRKPDDYTQHSQIDQENVGPRGNRLYPMQNGSGYPPSPGQNGITMPPPNNTRQPIKLTTSDSGPPPTLAEIQPKGSGKRQSWIKRRFSRRDT